MDCIALALHISIRPAYIYTLQHCVVGFSCFIACHFRATTAGVQSEPTLILKSTLIL